MTGKPVGLASQAKRWLLSRSATPLGPLIQVW